MVEAPKTTYLAGKALAETQSRNERHAALFERITSRIYRYFLKNVWDAGEAEELAQRTLFALERSLRERSYDPARSFNTWMWIKAHDVFVRHCRERGRRADQLSDGEGHEPPSPRADHAETIGERLDAETALRTLQRRLGDETYEIFVLYYEGGLTQVEIAESVGRDRKTVRTRLREAHRLIHELLEIEDRRP